MMPQGSQPLLLSPHPLASFLFSKHGRDAPTPGAFVPAPLSICQEYSPLQALPSFPSSLLIFFFFPFFPLSLDLNILFFSTLFSNIFPGLSPFSILTPCFNLLIRIYHFLTYYILFISLAYRLSLLLECKLPEGRDFIMSTAVLLAPKTVPGKC